MPRVRLCYRTLKLRALCWVLRRQRAGQRVGNAEDYAAEILLTNARASMINAWISHTFRHSRRLPDRWSAA
jgi:hypothetical protein